MALRKVTVGCAGVALDAAAEMGCIAVLTPL